MKSQNKSFIIGLIILFCCLTFSIGFEVAYSDSGWDSSYDSGGYDYDYGGGYDYDYGGGYDYDYDYDDYDYDYGSDYSGGSGGSPEAVVFVFILIAIFIIIFYFSLKNQNNLYKQGKSVPSKSENPEYYIDNMTAFMKHFARTDLNIIKEDIYNKFVDIQNAWMEFDYDKLRELCTDELYNSYKSQLSVLKAKNGKNIMSNFKLKTLSITDVKEQNGQLLVEVFMGISFFDYVINTTTNEVTRGNKNKMIHNNYLMTFIKSKKTSKITKCPNCNAPLKKNHSSTCDYCNSNIVLESDKLILSKKTNIKQL